MKPPKKLYYWIGHPSQSHPCADNTESIVSLTPKPVKWVFSISYAYYAGDRGDYYKPGWRWGCNVWWSRGNLLQVYPPAYPTHGYNSVRADYEAYPTEKLCIEAALLAVYDKTETLLATYPDLAVDLCHEAMNPFWDAVAPHLERRDWLADCRAPRLTHLTQQLSFI